MSHQLRGDGRHDGDEPISRFSRARFRTMLESEKVVLSLLLVVFTAILGWMVKLQLDTLYTVSDIKSTINRHSEQIATQDRRITVQEATGQSILIINDRLKMQEERLQEHTRAIVTAEGILHDMEKRLAAEEANTAANIANHIAIERWLSGIQNTIEKHSKENRK